MRNRLISRGSRRRRLVDIAIVRCIWRGGGSHRGGLGRFIDETIVGLVWLGDWGLLRLLLHKRRVVCVSLHFEDEYVKSR